MSGYGTTPGDFANALNLTLGGSGGIPVDQFNAASQQLKDNYDYYHYNQMINGYSPMDRTEWLGLVSSFPGMSFGSGGGGGGTTPPPGTTTPPGASGPLPPSAFMPQLPTLGSSGRGGQSGGLNGLLNPYLLYLPQGRADTVTAITGAPLTGSTTPGGK